MELSDKASDVQRVEVKRVIIYDPKEMTNVLNKYSTESQGSDYIPGDFFRPRG